jgi:hypothetical protein
LYAELGFWFLVNSQQEERSSPGGSFLEGVQGRKREEKRVLKDSWSEVYIRSLLYVLGSSVASNGECKN